MSTQATKPPRGRRAIFGRESVIEAATQIVREDGLDALTIPHLGRRLGSAQGTIYRYFTSKDELLDELACRILQDFPPVDASETRDWSEWLEWYFTNLRQSLIAHPEFARILRDRPMASARAGDQLAVCFTAMKRGGLRARQA